jgi:hypothetical protein
MTRLVLVLALGAFAAVACGDDVTAPTTQPLIFSATLFPANEVPAITNAESGGLGAVQVQFDGSSATFYFQLDRFPATSIIGAHIHPGPAGVNGPVIISTGLTAAMNLQVPKGATEFKVTVPVDPALVQAITANPAAYYFNVHSPLNPGGFARGQLQRVR